MSSFRIIIPTRDSASWISIFLDRYRAIGVEPLYIVDTRSCDDTINILIEQQADFISFTPSGDFAETGMIEFGAKNATAKWILRIDDDEFPSQSLLKWIGEHVIISKYDAFSISCREVHLRDGELLYSRWPTRLGWNGDYNLVNPLLRLFRKESVQYTQQVHTTGIELPALHAYAPKDCFFIHCNCILRTPKQRIEKIRKYALHNRELAWTYIDESLPELLNFETYNYASDGLSEFTELFKRLPIAADRTIPDLSKEELWLIINGAQKWLGMNAVKAQNLIREEQNTGGLRGDSYNSAFSTHGISTKSIQLPLVTVIITNHNYAPYIGDAVQSVMSQTYPRVECIIVDDCSTDGSPKVIETLLKDAPKGAYKVVYLTENVGQLGAMKIGLANSSGAFINFLDADDVLLPNFIEAHVLVHLNSLDSASVSGSDTLQIDGRDQILEGTNFLIKKNRGELGLNNPNQSLIKTIDNIQIPRIEGRNLLFGEIKYSVSYIDPSIQGWFVVATSALVFRRAVLEYIIPQRVEAVKLSADSFVYPLAHAIGGTLTISSALSCYRIHENNNWARKGVLGGPNLCGTVNVDVEKEISGAIAEHITQDITLWSNLIGKARVAKFLKQGLFEESAGNDTQ